MGTYIAGSSTTDGGTVLTIPAGEAFFQGTITLSAAQNGLTGGSASVNYPSVTVEGGLAFYSPGDVMAQVAVAAPAINLLSLLGTSNSNSVVVPVTVISAASEAATLKLNFNGASGVCAAASGSY
jgi:hypothetical protein